VPTVLACFQRMTKFIVYGLKMRTRLLYVILLQSLLHSTSAQLDSLRSLPFDSLMKWIVVECQTLNQELPQLAYFALATALHDNDIDAAANIHDKLSFWNYMNYEVYGVDSIMYHRIKQIEYDEQEANWDKVAKGYIDLAIDYSNNNQMNLCMETLFKALEIYQTLNDESGIAQVNGQIASRYIDIDDYENALTYADLCMPIFEHENQYLLIAELYVSVYGRAHFEQGNLDAALQYFDRCIQLCHDHDVEQETSILTHAYEYKAEVHIERMEYEAAESYLYRSWQLNIENSSKEMAEYTRFPIGDVLYQQEKYAEALPHLIAGAEAAKSLPAFNSSYDQKIADCYDKLGQYEQAFFHQKQAAELSAEIKQDEIASLKSEALIKYDSGRKDQELIEKERIIEQKNSIQSLSIGIAGLLAVLLSTLFYFFSKNRKTNAILQSKNTLIEERNQQNELLLKEIHHRVKNNLENVSALLMLQGEKINDANAKSAMKASLSRVDAMGLLHQRLYQGINLGAIEMKDYFLKLSEGVLESFDQEDKVNIELAMDPLELDIDTAVPIGLIVNELLTNALKYAFPPVYDAHIKIKLEQLNQDELRLEVVDNGVGFEVGQAPIGTGFGTQLVELFTKQLRGTMDTTIDNGTIISLTLKKSKAA